jgi:hypothetical protein
MSSKSGNLSVDGSTVQQGLRASYVDDVMRPHITALDG